MNKSSEARGVIRAAAGSNRGERRSRHPALNRQLLLRSLSPAFASFEVGNSCSRVLLMLPLSVGPIGNAVCRASIFHLRRSVNGVLHV
ncbi:hypothetical protein EYF80_054270 [Liparis tanakae]|uniref:Uncharacterized protein n=1 Tax=Liparis tanakae TaxID=230148 RepID=A0A4Z2F3V2_9TELE|nr:hypothetical protein EYF80_054270 [Liparis tanakae]